MLIKTLYLNGQIFTSNREMPFAEAMAVSLGSFNLVGTNQEVLESVGAKDINDPKLRDLEVIDLKGRTVIPGFIDADIRDTEAGENFSLAWNKDEALAQDIASKSKDLAAKGIVAFGALGVYEDHDIFDSYLAARDKGLNQYVSLYYPLEFAAKNEDLFQDKVRQVRDRQVHVSGLTIPGEKGTDKDDEEKALKICSENALQLSVLISEDDPSKGLIEGLQREDNWMEETEIPNIRVHKGLSNFNPFVDIKKDLIEALNRAAETGGNTEYIDLSTEVMGYTKYSASMAGFAGLGEIKVGNKACFIITNKSLANIAVDELDTVMPEVTIIDGRIAYKAPDSTFSLRDNTGVNTGLRLTK